MSGLLLRLAGPLQSWGERSAFTLRDTALFPTRSAIIGMFSAAEGRGRHQDPRIYADLGLTVRIDRPGQVLVDYHTVGGGLESDRTLATSGGKHKGAAVISRRHYLADAVFVVAVTGPPEHLDRISRSLERPHWAPYLGRRSCPPDEPFVLRSSVDDPVAELCTRVPLAPADDITAPQISGAPDTVPVEFLWETPPNSGVDSVTTVADVPESFAVQGSRYGQRRLYRTVEALPSTLRVPPRELHSRLVDYALENPR